MGISKITLNGVTQMDVTGDTVTAATLFSDYTATGADGEQVTGTYVEPTARSSSDVTVSGATVTVPAGAYSSQVTKTVASGSAATPATTITANPSITVSSSGLITATASASKAVTPTVSAGYISSGTSGTVTVSGSNTQQLTTQAAKTVTPTTSSQQAVAAGRYTTGAVTVAAIPSDYADITGVTASASDVRKGTYFVNSSGVLTEGTFEGGYNVDITLSASNWSGSAAPYTQTVSASGVTSSDTPDYKFLVPSTITTLSDTEAYLDECNKLYKFVTGTDSVTFYANDLPTLTIEMQLEYVEAK